jgi:16S rRNA (cytidine1402-2'-O)-methyltransferase
MSRRENAKIISKYQPSSAGASPEDTGGRVRPSAAQPFEGLAIVATPIGHSRDITLRALDILGRADWIACEDTRVTAKLLAIHGISRPLVAYHEHNAEKARPKLIERLKGGETVALVSDAGTPLVSDPGYKLVRACLEEGIPVIPVPGASAILAALVVSGLPTDRFFFAGFLSSKSAARRRALVDVAEIPGSLVFLESARRLAPSLTDMARILGPRDAMIGREMTKMFEETRRGPLDDLAAHYKSEGPPRGEVTIVVAPFKKQAVDDAGLDRRLKAALKNATVRDAANEVAAATGLARRKVYTRALKLQKGEKQVGPK